MNAMNIISLWEPAVEILILWFLIYHIMLFFEGTRAIQVLRGIILLLLVFFLFQKLGLEVLDWIFRKLFAISVIALLIIFHPEIRQGLARLGQRSIFGTSLKEEDMDYILGQVVRAAENLCRDKIGALIAIEKNDPLTTYVENGVLIDAGISPELIHNIFTPNSMLHDGGVVMQRGRITAAGCLFPLTQNQDLSRVYGTRHRAALGLSEETDALVVIVSEERVDISLAYRGKFYKDLGRDELLKKMKELIRMRKEDV